MSTELEDRTDVDLDVNLEDDVPCTVKDCEFIAEWVYDATCCGFQVLVCAHHKEVLQFGWVLIQISGFACNGCGQLLFDEPLWRRL